MLNKLKTSIKKPKHYRRGVTSDQDELVIPHLQPFRTILQSISPAMCTATKVKQPLKTKSLGSKICGNSQSQAMTIPFPSVKKTSGCTHNDRRSRKGMQVSLPPSDLGVTNGCSPNSRLGDVLFLRPLISWLAIHDLGGVPNGRYFIYDPGLGSLQFTMIIYDSISKYPINRVHTD